MVSCGVAAGARAATIARIRIRVRLFFRFGIVASPSLGGLPAAARRRASYRDTAGGDPSTWPGVVDSHLVGRGDRTPPRRSRRDDGAEWADRAPIEQGQLARFDGKRWVLFGSSTTRARSRGEAREAGARPPPAPSAAADAHRHAGVGASSR